MKLTLLIEGKKKEFKTSFIPGMIFRRALELNKRIDFSNMQAEDLDEIVQLTVELYGNEFSFDEFYKGIPLNELLPTLTNVMTFISNGGVELEKEELGKSE